MLTVTGLGRQLVRTLRLTCNGARPMEEEEVEQEEEEEVAAADTAVAPLAVAAAKASDGG